jgi:hypothetical protein
VCCDIAAIQDQAAQQAEVWGGVERALSSRCREAEAKAHEANTRKRQTQGLLIEANSKVSSLEAKLQQEENAREVCELTAMWCEFTAMCCEFTAMCCELTAMCCELTAIWCELTGMWCEFTATY